MIGVIGGMGPLATVDFLNKVIEERGAVDDDADHVPLLVSNDPRIPKRPAAILGGGESPLPRLLEIRDRLVAGGATALVMPCNTAHFWHAALAAGCPVPFLSIVDAGCDAALRVAGAGATVGVMGTRATLASGLFEAALAQRGLSGLAPSADELDRLVLPAVAAVKRGDLPGAAASFADALAAMARRGARHVLLACTELPVVLDRVPPDLAARCVDNNRALAHATVAWWRAHGGGSGT